MSYFSTNLAHIRKMRGITRTQLAEKLKVNYSTISRWENGDMGVTVDNAFDVANILDVSLPELLGKDLRFDNTNFIQLDKNVIRIPVYGTIKAGIPIESQSDIIDYVDILESWTKGNKKFYGLKISGDSMFPKYNENDIVIFEQNDDIESFNGRDCAVMINGSESTFKKVIINEQGIILQPYNTSYDVMIFSKEQIEQLPIKIVGIAREKRTKL